MKKIPRVVFYDYCVMSMALVLFIVLLEPFGTRNFLQNNDNPYVYFFLEFFPFLLHFVVCDWVVSHCLRFPSDYSQTFDYQMKRLLLIFVPDVLLNALFNGLYFRVLGFGLDGFCTYTFPMYLHVLKEAVFVGLFFFVGYAYITVIRIQRFQIEELKSLNSLIEKEQQSSACAEISASEKKIILPNDGRDSFAVSPSEIVYLESVGNYVNVVYFSEMDVSQKRLRSSLKDVETALSDYAFIVHVHRAFVVNLRFVTQVSGNSAGYKLQLFGSDKIIPVSKANIRNFKEKIKS